MDFKEQAHSVKVETSSANVSFLPGKHSQLVCGHRLRHVDSRFPVFFFSSRRRHTRFDCDWSSDVCSSDLNLAALLHLKGDYAGAEPLYREALHIRLKLRGPEHTEVATTLTNLAMLLVRKGEIGRASCRERV